MWLLESAPGLPRDGPISFGDLGAGTCAACLGARYALRDHSGGDHPYVCWPIDVASSSARFAEAFSAMVATAAGLNTRDALLPLQSASQYLTEEADGVDHLVTSMLRQVAQRGARQPHVILASFSLHYLKGPARAAFYELLAAAIRRPLLLLIIKGVDSVRKHQTGGMVPDSVPSVFLGIHYYLGKDPKPRVVEAHVALIRPAAQHVAVSTGEQPRAALDELPDLDHPDAWVLATFAAVQRRYERDGLHTGVTDLAVAEKRQALASAYL